MNNPVVTEKMISYLYFDVYFISTKHFKDHCLPCKITLNLFKEFIIEDKQFRKRVSLSSLTYLFYTDVFDFVKIYIYIYLYLFLE